MVFSKKIIAGILIAVSCILNPGNLYAGNPDAIKAEPDNKGNITFTVIVDNLPLKSPDILETARKYLEEEYKTAKYTDIKVMADKGIAYGKGNLNAFYTENKIANSIVYNLDYILRFDCKDGKARIQIIAKDYTLNNFSDIKGTETSIVEIVTTPPFAEGKKNFNKVYNAVETLANEILESGKQALKSATPIPEAEDW